MLFALMMGVNTHATRLNAGTLEWRTVQSGIQYTQMSAGPTDTGMSSALKIHVMKFSPEKWSIRPYFYEEFKPPLKGCGLQEWQEKVKSPLLLNGGQYEIDLSYIGVLQRQGKKIGRQKKITWKAYLVSDPKKSGFPQVDILDALKPGDLAKLNSYQTVAQTFMLFDSNHKIRVQHSGQVAERSIIGVGADGEIYILVTEGIVGLWELADWIQKKSGLKLRKALSLDGADKSAMRVSFLKGEPKHLEVRGESTAPSCSLPSVLGLVPR